MITSPSRRTLLFCSLLLLTSSGWSTDGAVPLLLLRDPLSAAVPAPWKLKTKEGQPDFRVQREGGVLAACLTSRSSSFSIQRTAEVDLDRFPLLTWQWLASELPPQGDLRRGDSDDQAAQLFVLFAGGKAISYVWDSNAPVGTVAKSSIPFLLTIQALVVESGPGRLGAWQVHERNVRRDFERLFGGSTPDLQAIRFQINSQHTQSDARSCIASISFGGRPPNAGSEPGPRASPGELFATADASETWTVAAEHLPPILAVRPGRPSR